MDSDAFSRFLYLLVSLNIFIKMISHITLLLFTYTIYQLCILCCLIVSFFYNPTKQQNEKEKKKEMRSHFHKMITFCFFGKQYMTNKTSIDNSFSF